MSIPNSPSPSSGINHLLAALPPEDAARISPHLTLAPLRARQVLYKREEPLKQVFFPGRSLCSLLLTMEDGASAEIAVVGPEGVVGVEVALGLRSAACDATVQVAGEGYALVMNVDTFRSEIARPGVFGVLVQNYARAFIGFVTQSVACNALHSVEARCCRWLLHAQDRLASSDLPLTHDLLSAMLGVRRPTVTLVLNDLTQTGMLSTSRGMLRIVDRHAVETRACDCYRTVTGIFDKCLAAHAWPQGSKVVGRQPNL
jgi:CRP-like cAMP-binding protein